MEKIIICDTCKKEINRAEEGRLEWYTGLDLPEAKVATGFRIVHKHEDCCENEDRLNREEKSLMDRELDQLIDYSPEENLRNIQKHFTIENEEFVLRVLERI